MSQNQSRTPRLLDPKQAAAVLGVSWRTLERWRRHGAGPVFLRMSARSIRYRLSDVERWLDQQRRASTSATSPPPGDAADRLAAARRRLAR